LTVGAREEEEAVGEREEEEAVGEREEEEAVALWTGSSTVKLKPPSHK
jgi:hypothetical protein